MKLARKVLIAVVANMGIAIPMAAPAFASASTVNALSSDSVLTGCVTPVQIEAAATLALANWSANETALGTSAPAGVTVNGDWFPASLDFAAPWAVSIFTCPPPSVKNSLDLATSQAVLTGCVTLAQIQAAATLTLANWSLNEKTDGISAPAGVTVNGTWFPAGLLTTRALPAAAATC